MGPTVLVKADPLCDDTRGVLCGFKAMTMYELLSQRPDDTLDHAVLLLRALRCDEPLLEAVTAHKARIGSRGEDQAAIQPQPERRRNTSERPEPLDQRLLERGHRRCCSTASRELPAKQFSRVTVDDEGQGLPVITARSDAAEICRPAFVRRCGDRRERLDTQSMSDGSLANLPALELEDPLDRVLIELQQARDGSVTKPHRLRHGVCSITCATTR